MPLTNRVDPHGRIFATPARGLFMGNRGRLHDEHKQLQGRPWRTKAWIICSLQFNGRRRELMAAGSYTELFFLDEATALAAGHRPCAECRRERYRTFLAAAGLKSGDGSPGRAADLDLLLHAQRVQSDGQKRTWQAQAGDLPDGTLVQLDRDAWLVQGARRLKWSPDGYGEPGLLRRNEVMEVLTPELTVEALRNGYEPLLHPSAVPSGVEA